jgi:hypothetical protein
MLVYWLQQTIARHTLEHFLTEMASACRLRRANVRKIDLKFSKHWSAGVYQFKLVINIRGGKINVHQNAKKVQNVHYASNTQ